MKYSTLLQWLVALIPTSMVIIVVLVSSPPVDADFLDLTGTWSGATYERDAWSPERPAPVPGNLAVEGFHHPHLRLRRTVELPEHLQQAELGLTLGYVADAAVVIRANGQVVGRRGDAATTYLGSKTDLSTFLIPAVRASTVDLEIELSAFQVEELGIKDSSVTLGPYARVERWAFRARALRNMLGFGGLSTLSFIAFMIGTIWWLDRRGVNHSLYRASMGLLLAAMAFLTALTGFPVSLLFSGSLNYGWTIGSVELLALSLTEFYDAFFNHRTTTLGRISRVVCLVAFAATVIAAPISTAWVGTIYNLFAVWLLIMVAQAIRLSWRAMQSQAFPFATLLFVTVVSNAMSGVNDLLADLNVISSIRIYWLSVFNLASVVAVVVLAEFIRLSDANRALSSSLSVRNEELSLALAQANESVRLKTEFLASTSHELRTPLNAIINIPQGILEEFVEVPALCCPACGATRSSAGPCDKCGAMVQPDSSLRFELEPKRAVKLLKNVVTAGEHLLHIVNDVLDFSKIEASRMTLQLEVSEYQPLWETVQATVETTAQRAGVTLRHDALADGALIQVDRVKFVQILINLVNNAVKFSDGKGTVTVTSRANNGCLMIAVRDEGIGIAPEHQKFIFEGFRQVEGGSTRRFGGTGLGLAISKRLTELHGGSLTLESALGQGSTFTLTLPLATNAAADEKPTSGAPTPQS